MIFNLDDALSMSFGDFVLLVRAVTLDVGHASVRVSLKGCSFLWKLALCGVKGRVNVADFEHFNIDVDPHHVRLDAFVAGIRAAQPSLPDEEVFDTLFAWVSAERRWVWSQFLRVS